MKVIERYVCEKCGTEYVARVFAEICEAGDIPPMPDLIGKRVEVEVDHSTYQDVVKTLTVGPGIIQVTASEAEPDDARIAFIRRLKENNHVWRAELGDYYDFDGMEIPYFYIDNLKVLEPSETTEQN